MTNREKFEQYMQRQVNLLKNLSDEELAIALNYSDDLWAFARAMGTRWKYVKDTKKIPSGQTELIIQWLKEENTRT